MDTMTKRNVFTEDETEKLFSKYLEICNQALVMNRKKSPFKDIFRAASEAVEDIPFELAVYDDRPKGVFTLHLKGEQLVPGERPLNEEAAWRLHLSEIQQVVENAIYYIEHPELLQLDWLKSRFG